MPLSFWSCRGFRCLVLNSNIILLFGPFIEYSGILFSWKKRSVKCYCLHKKLGFLGPALIPNPSQDWQEQEGKSSGAEKVSSKSHFPLIRV